MWSDRLFQPQENRDFFIAKRAGKPEKSIDSKRLGIYFKRPKRFQSNALAFQMIRQGILLNNFINEKIILSWFEKKYSQNHTSRISFLLQPPKGLFYLASADLWLPHENGYKITSYPKILQGLFLPFLSHSLSYTYNKNNWPNVLSYYMVYFSYYCSVLKSNSYLCIIIKQEQKYDRERTS